MTLSIEEKTQKAEALIKEIEHVRCPKEHIDLTWTTLTEPFAEKLVSTIAANGMLKSGIFSTDDGGEPIKHERMKGRIKATFARNNLRAPTSRPRFKQTRRKDTTNSAELCCRG